MANTYHQIYLQTVFAVKYRKAVIDKSWKSQLFGVIGNLINEANCKTIIVNGIEDHVHCFIGLKPVISVSEINENSKGQIIKIYQRPFPNTSQIRMAGSLPAGRQGYGVFTYSQRDVDTVYKYIQHQEEHHKVQTFREEYFQLLKEFKVEYDEQYIFQGLI